MLQQYVNMDVENITPQIPVKKLNKKNAPIIQLEGQSNSLSSGINDENIPIQKPKRTKTQQQKLIQIT